LFFIFKAGLGKVWQGQARLGLERCGKARRGVAWKGMARQGKDKLK